VANILQNWKFHKSGINLHGTYIDSILNKHDSLDPEAEFEGQASQQGAQKQQLDETTVRLLLVIYQQKSNV